MICKVCKKKETNNKLGICDPCGIEIQLSFTYFVAGKEITKEEYEERIKNE